MAKGEKEQSASKKKIPKGVIIGLGVGAGVLAIAIGAAVIVKAKKAGGPSTGADIDGYKQENEPERALGTDVSAGIYLKELPWSRMIYVKIVSPSGAFWNSQPVSIGDKYQTWAALNQYLFDHRAEWNALAAEGDMQAVMYSWAMIPWGLPAEDAVKMSNVWVKSDAPSGLSDVWKYISGEGTKIERYGTLFSCPFPKGMSKTVSGGWSGGPTVDPMQYMPTGLLSKIFWNRKWKGPRYAIEYMGGVPEINFACQGKFEKNPGGPEPFRYVENKWGVSLYGYDTAMYPHSAALAGIRDELTRKENDWNSRCAGQTGCIQDPGGLVNNIIKRLDFQMNRVRGGTGNCYYTPSYQ